MNRAERRRQQKKDKKTSKDMKSIKSASSLPGEQTLTIDQQVLTIDQAINLSIQRLTSGRLPEAKSGFQQILQTDPNQPVALHLLGVIAYQTGKHDLAVDLIKKALAIKPDYAEAHYNLGNALRELVKLDEAEASYQKALTINPDSAASHRNLGIVFRKQGKLDEAVVSYQNALSIKPDYAEAHISLGNAFSDQGKLDEAVASYHKALAIKPDSAATHNNLGLALRELVKLDEAVTSYHKALAIKPNFAEAHSNLGNALKEMGKLDEAVTSFQKALAIKPDYADAHYSLCLARKNLPGDPQILKVRELLESRSLLVDEKTKLQFALAKALDDTGVYEEASSYFRRANEAMAKQAIARHKQFDRIGHRKTVNEVKRVVFRQRPRAAKKKAEAEHTPIFVVGMSRSGKTLVESLLGQHDGVLKNGEGFEFHNAINEVRNNYALPKFPPKFMETLNDKQIDEIGALYTQKSTSKFPEAQYSVNTMPGQFLHLGLIFNALANAKVIYCLRDPLDCCLLQYFQRNTRIAYANNFADIAWYCADYEEMMSHWKKLYGNQILDVRYEDLVSNPDETGRLVFQHCGLDLDPAKVCSAFTTDEIGHWRHYPEEADILRRALEEQRQLANKTEI
jgi:tetratricopeptide (TPR) repeat protein